LGRETSLFRDRVEERKTAAIAGGRRIVFQSPKSLLRKYQHCRAAMVGTTKKRGREELAS